MPKGMKKRLSVIELEKVLKKFFGYLPQIESDDFGQIIIYTDYMELVEDGHDTNVLIPFVNPEDR